MGGLQARAMIAHTSSAAIRSGPPQRGASRKRSATVPRTPAPESHRARQALTVLRQIPSLSDVPSIPRPSPKSNMIRARIASCCGVKDARIRRSSPSRSSSLNSIVAALRPISSLHREIIATENQTTENKSLICESELTPTCTSPLNTARDMLAKLQTKQNLELFQAGALQIFNKAMKDLRVDERTTRAELFTAYTRAGENLELTLGVSSSDFTASELHNWPMYWIRL